MTKSIPVSEIERFIEDFRERSKRLSEDGAIIATKIILNELEQLIKDEDERE